MSDVIGLRLTATVIRLLSADLSIVPDAPAPLRSVSKGRRVGLAGLMGESLDTR